MKRFLAAILCLLSLPGLHAARAAQAAPALSAQSAILVEKDSGTVLLEQDADTRRLIASTTKLMTALVVLEKTKPEDTVEILEAYTRTEGSSMYLKAGEKYSVRELLYGLLLHSGNDAATALACHVAGSEADFAALMNEKAAQLGMTNSSFENPHGLDGQAHYSTARDMAKLAAAVLDQPLLAEIVSTKEITLAGRRFINHNKLLWNCAGVIGLKTGYTKAAGRTLVSACCRGGATLICVTLCDGDDWNDHSRLYDWGFQNYSKRELVARGQSFGGLEVISGQRHTVGVEAKTGLSAFLREGEEPEVEISLPDFAYAPLTAGERAGEALLKLDGRILGRVELVYTSTVPADESQRLSRWEKLKRSWYLANQNPYLAATGGSRP